MSKTFKSASSERKVRIWEANLGVAVCVEDPITNEATSTQIAPSDAPALALAILEAAGADSDLKWSGAKDYGNADHLGWIAGHLGAYIKTQERVTAEAKEQAELVNPDAVTRSIMGYQLRSSCLVEPAGECKACRSVVEAIITDYLAVAQPVVNSMEVPGA